MRFALFNVWLSCDHISCDYHVTSLQNLHHMYRAYGGWTFAFDDYMAMNFTARLDDPNTQAMFDIVDPYGISLSNVTFFQYLLTQL